MPKKKSKDPIDIKELGKELYVSHRYCCSRVDRSDAIFEWNTQCLEIEKEDYIATAKQFYQYIIDNAE